MTHRPVGVPRESGSRRRRRATRLDENGGIDRLDGDRCASAVMARYPHQPDIQQALTLLPRTRARGVRWRLSELRS